jgi:hypothetical protein
MAASLDARIREHLADYVSGKTSLWEFDDWFIPATWDVDKSGDQPLIDLTYEIILRLAEYSNGDCSEAELKDLLRPVVDAAVPA